MPEQTGKKTGKRGKAPPAPPEAEPVRLPDGRFPPGRSGNPHGRPKGSLSRTTELARQLMEGDVTAIMRKAIELAKAGDPVGLRLCVERLYPAPRRGAAVEIELPEIRKAGDVAAAAAEVIAAAAAGRMTTGEAREFLQLLELQRRSIETEDLAVRLELLEAAGRKKR